MQMQELGLVQGGNATCQRIALPIWLISLIMAKVINLPNMVPGTIKENFKTANIHTPNDRG